MENFYELPVSKEYVTRGCKVSINGAFDSRVDINVKNIKTGLGSGITYILDPIVNRTGYTENDMIHMKNYLNSLLDEYGEPECREIHFTNQILS
jgi:hypothetical protein